MLLKETLFLNPDHKYKVQSLFYENGNTEVMCEILENGDFIKLKLEDIIRKNKLQFFSTPDILVLLKNFENSTRNIGFSTNHQTKYYHTISTVFILCLLMSNIAEIKICNFFDYSIGAGSTIFPLVYILNDILTEVYGFSSGRKTIWIALFANCIFSVFLYGIALLPPSEHWTDQENFEKLFFVSPRIVIASVVSYLIGEMINASIIASLKIKFKGKFFAMRAIVSTCIGSLIESTIFGYIAFFGRIPDIELIKMILLLTIIKLIYEILAMPITIKVVSFLKKAEDKDIYETPTLKGFLPKFLFEINK